MITNTEFQYVSINVYKMNQKLLFQVPLVIFKSHYSTDLSLSHYVPLGPHLPRQSRGNLLSKPVQQVRHPRPSRSSTEALLHMTIQIQRNTIQKLMIHNTQRRANRQHDILRHVLSHKHRIQIVVVEY